MIQLKNYEFWFVVGSQGLYGLETLKVVEKNAKEISQFLDEHHTSNSKIILKTVATDSEKIKQICEEANADSNCAGVITWMHTFSPAKMWINGLSILNKPLLHFHTQYNRDIPWDKIDMDFMNLNQSAHGGREFGFIGARLKIKRKIIVGYWKDNDVLSDINKWINIAISQNESQKLKVARFGDNMRSVAVTEGDKVEAQIKFGWTVDAYGVGDLVEYVEAVTDNEANELYSEYDKLYIIDDSIKSDEKLIEAVKYQAKIEIALTKFLDERNCTAFTTNFENLHGLKQLPGLAVQRLMEKGYGFGAEGDWKTAALLRLMKIMANGKNTSFMEDYTYHLETGNEMILGAHMLEVCPTVAKSKPSIVVSPLGIGNRADPSRLVFDGKKGSALCASLIDLGNRFRLIINTVEAVEIENKMTNLPVARVLWKPDPSLRKSAEAWILAGGAHHTCFSYDVTVESLVDWCEMTNIECLVIDKNTEIHNLKKDILYGEITWK